MTIKPGTILKSTSVLNETIFEDTIILITANDDTGAVGFILNQPANRKLNDLEEFKTCKSFPLFIGGPVDGEHLFFIHSRADIIANGNPVSNGIYYGGDFSQTVSAINIGILTVDELKIFIGYCGWDAGELEAEVEEGSWTLAEGMPVFNTSKKY